MRAITLLFLLLIAITPAFAKTHYVNAVVGSDSNSGESPLSAWKTITKINSSAVSGGDTVLFNRGDIFRGNLIPVSGYTGKATLYGAYGTGEKPKIFGSVNKSKSTDWINIGKNIWQLEQNVITNPAEILTNADFTTDLNNWNEWHNTSAGAKISISRTTAPGTFYSAPAALKLSCTDNGQNISDIQLWTADYAISAEWHILTFRAKATKHFSIPSSAIAVFKNGAPYTQYALPVPKTYDIDTTWNSFSVILQTSESTSGGARINFMFGGFIPDSSDLYLDSLSLKSLKESPTLLMNDVGNIIFNNELLCGLKTKDEAALNSQGMYWYDANNFNVKLFSSSNPAQHYTNIEIALTKDIIGQGAKSYVTYKNLDLRYGSAHGIGGGATQNITVQDVDISYIGGGFLPGFGDGFVRYGNGIEFWNSAHDNIVERCTFNHIYDAALTAQGIDSNGYEVSNIIFRNNIIRNSEFSFELWARGLKSYMHHVYFENNTCLNAGFGWGSTQRPDPNGTHVICWGFLARSNDVYIRNNIFSETSDYGSRWLNSFELEKVILDNNCWYESEGAVSRIINTDYDFATEWELYKTASKQDSHSIPANPLLNNDYTLKAASPCIDTGYPTIAVSTDFAGNARPNGRKIDIGAFEFYPLSADEFGIKEQLKNVTNYLQDNESYTIEIISANGQLIRSFNSNHSVMWDGRKNNGSQAASGVYFLKLKSAKKTTIKKIVLQR